MENLENLVAENIELRKRLEAIKELQDRMDRISMVVAKYDGGVNIDLIMLIALIAFGNDFDYPKSTI